MMSRAAYAKTASMQMNCLMGMGGVRTRSRTNPIPCRTMLGSTAYLRRLRTMDGAKVSHERLGSTMSDVSPHPIDIYEISAIDGGGTVNLYVPLHITNGTRQRRLAALYWPISDKFLFAGPSCVTAMIDGRLSREAEYVPPKHQIGAHMRWR